MATFWSATDKSASIALSNGNHTATTTGGGNFGGRATTSKSGSTGKFYLEFSAITLGGGGGGDACFGTATDALGGGGQFGVTDSGNVYPSGSTGNLGGTVAGHVVGVAIDFGAKLFWARYDAGSWYGDNSGIAGNPAAGTHGCSISASSFPVFPMYYLQNFTSNATITLNAGDSTFANAIPSGYVAWDGVPIFPYSQARVIG